MTIRRMVEWEGRASPCGRHLDLASVQAGMMRGTRGSHNEDMTADFKHVVGTTVTQARDVLHGCCLQWRGTQSDEPARWWQQRHLDAETAARATCCRTACAESGRVQVVLTDAGARREWRGRNNRPAGRVRGRGHACTCGGDAWCNHSTLSTCGRPRFLCGCC
jgi:hypothetical protein